MISVRSLFNGASTVLVFTISSLSAVPFAFAQTPVTQQPTPQKVTPHWPVTPADFAAILDDTARTSRTSSIVAAQEAQATDADLKVLLDDAVQTARELKKVDEKLEKLKPQAIAWKQKLDQHNANQCTYPEGHPEVCAAYDEEARALTAERDRLRAAFAENDGQRRTLKNRLGILKARLRITAALVYQCRCADLGPEEAKACWDRCFDNADPLLRSCLDIADLDLFASCLARSGLQ